MELFDLEPLFESGYAVYNGRKIKVVGFDNSSKSLIEIHYYIFNKTWPEMHELNKWVREIGLDIVYPNSRETLHSILKDA